MGKRRPPAERLYLKPEESAKLSAAILSGNVELVERYNRIIQQRKTADEAQKAVIAKEAAEKLAATRKKRSNTRLTWAVVVIPIGAFVAAMLIFRPGEGPVGGGSGQIELRTSGPCDTAISDINDRAETTISDMKVNQTGWVTYWTVAHDQGGDWIDTDAKADEAGGGTLNVCIQHTPGGWEAWMGPDPIIGDRNSTGPKQNWVHVTIHPQGQK